MELKDKNFTTNTTPIVEEDVDQHELIHFLWRVHGTILENNFSLFCKVKDLPNLGSNNSTPRYIP